eukprot:2938587-Rhodomonas_salina.2
MLTRAVKSCLLFVALACTCEAFSPSLLPSVLPNPASMRSDVRRRQGSLSLRAQQGNGQLSEAMKKKLAAESDAPLRFPLLWAAAVLAGKGSTDLVFTELKYLTGVSKVARRCPSCRGRGRLTTLLKQMDLVVCQCPVLTSV